MPKLFRAYFANGISRALAMLAILSVAFVAAPASAVGWRLKPRLSELQFIYQEDGTPQQGRFARFGGDGSFSRREPRSSRLLLTIDMDSIELADSFRNDFVKAETWFDTAHHPKATFELTDLEPIEADRFRASGTLSIKDIHRTISTLITLTVDRDTAVASGEISFDRFDFDVGDRMGGLFIDIGDLVTVRFQLIAERL